MTYNEALETMCKRCTNYEVCRGTGCEPKKTLAEFPNKVVDMLEQQATNNQIRADWYKAKDNDLHDPFEAMRCEDGVAYINMAIRIIKEALNG